MLHDFINGLRASFRTPSIKTIAWCFAICLVFAGLFALVVYGFVARRVDGSAISESLRNGIDIDWTIDTLGSDGFGASFRMLATLAVALVPAYLVVSVFLSGGIVSSVRRALGYDDDTTRVSFFTLCAWYLGPMARVAILEVVVLLAVTVGVAIGARSGGPTTRENVLAWVWLFGSAYALTLVASLFDYARIEVVAAGRRSAFSALGSACRLAGRKPLGVAVLALLNMALSLGVWVGFVWLHSNVNLTTAGGVAAGVLVGQIGIIGRFWTRVVAYASETSLHARGAVVPARVEVQADPVEMAEGIA
ncbi:MAG TPA: hypothetical protein PLF26_05730 [Blastocatellia bacterium]|nr:hypothetical protein [Blastocatellia bacterium]